jgi:hypothetical protein
MCSHGNKTCKKKCEPTFIEAVDHLGVLYVKKADVVHPECLDVVIPKPVKADGTAFAIHANGGIIIPSVGGGVAGPTGPQGPIGPAGPTGATGATGAAGAGGTTEIVSAGFGIDVVRTGNDYNVRVSRTGNTGSNSINTGLISVAVPTAANTYDILPHMPLSIVNPHPTRTMSAMVNATMGVAINKHLDNNIFVHLMHDTVKFANQGGVVEWDQNSVGTTSTNGISPNATGSYIINIPPATTFSADIWLQVERGGLTPSAATQYAATLQIAEGFATYIGIFL